MVGERGAGHNARAPMSPIGGSDGGGW